MSLLTNGPHRASTYTRTETTDASGGQVVNYSASARNEDIQCLVRGANASEVLRFQQQNIVVTHIIATSSSVFRAGDKVVSNGLTYEVKTIKPQQGVGMIPSFYEISCEQLA